MGITEMSATRTGPFSDAESLGADVADEREGSIRSMSSRATRAEAPDDHGRVATPTAAGR